MFGGPDEVRLTLPRASRDVIQIKEFDQAEEFTSVLKTLAHHYITMAEAAGLAVGVLGLLGLFSSSIQLFELVEHGCNQSRDLGLLSVKFKVERMRMILWGEYVGLWTSEPAPASTRIHKHLLRSDVFDTVQDVLENMQMMIQEGHKLAEAHNKRVMNKSLLSITSEQQNSREVSAKLRWIFQDKRNVEKLACDLHQLNNSLAGLIQPSDPSTAFFTNVHLPVSIASSKTTQIDLPQALTFTRDQNASIGCLNLAQLSDDASDSITNEWVLFSKSKYLLAIDMN